MKNTTKENLKLWRSVCVTNPEWIKTANLGGRKISAINPQKQMKQASEIWGPYLCRRSTKKVLCLLNICRRGLSVKI
jgi:hypothetical protein